MALSNLLTDLRYTYTGRKAFLTSKVCTAVGIFVLISFLFGTIYLGAKVVMCKGGSQESILDRAGYYEALGDVEYNLNSSIDPCEDFYSYACGGWIQHNTIPPGRQYIAVRSFHRQALDDKFRAVLENPVDDASLGSAERKMKEFYRQCLREYGRVKGGAGPFVQDLLTDINGWYVTHPGTYKDKWDFTEVVSKLLLNYRVPVIFNAFFARYQGRMNKTLPYFYLDRRMRMYSVNEEQELAFNESVRELGKLMLRDANVTYDDEAMSRMDTYVDDVVHIKDLLRESISDRRFKHSRQMFTLEWINNNVTMIDWVRLIDNFFGNNIKVTQNMEIMFYAVERYANFSTQLALLPDKERMLNNYAVWTTLDYVSQYITWEYQNARMIFNKYFVKDTPIIWEVCFTQLKKIFPAVLTLEFFKSHTKLTTHREVIDIAKGVTLVLIKRIQSADWIDKDTKAIALTKLNDIDIHIGLPSDINEKSEVDAYFERLHINTTKDSLYKTLVKISQYQTFEFAYNLNKTWINNRLSHGYVITNGFGYIVKLVNAFNMLIIFSGGYQPPYYFNGGPASVNYGGLGYYATDELINSIFSSGRYYDSRGPKQTTSWWSNNTMTEFNSKTQCLLEYFQEQGNGPYLVNGETKTVKVNKNMLNVNEMVERSIALDLSYQAYLESQEPDNDMLTALRLNNKKLFFIKAAQNLCNNIDPKLEYDQLSRGKLSAKVEVNGMVSLHPAFTDIFQCKKGSKMIPKKYCDLL